MSLPWRCRHCLGAAPHGWLAWVEPTPGEPTHPTTQCSGIAAARCRACRPSTRTGHCAAAVWPTGRISPHLLHGTCFPVATLLLSPQEGALQQLILHSLLPGLSVPARLLVAVLEAVLVPPTRRPGEELTGRGPAATPLAGCSSFSGWSQPS